MRNADRFCKLKFSVETEISSDGQIIRDTSNKIWKEYQACFDNVSSNVNGLQYLLDEMKCLRTRIEEKYEKCPVIKDDMLQEIFGVRPSGSASVRPPLPSNNKGSRKRIPGPAELSCDGKKRKLKKCKACDSYGYHDKRTCPQKVKQVQGVQIQSNQSMQPPALDGQNVHTNGIPDPSIEVHPPSLDCQNVQTNGIPISTIEVQTACSETERIESNTFTEGVHGIKDCNSVLLKH